MKLYYSPGAGPLSSHIISREGGIEPMLEKVDSGSGKTASDRDSVAINPKGCIPALELDNGQILTEGPVIAQYLADMKPATGLAAANGTLERYPLQEMFGWTNSGIHKPYSPLFNSKTLSEARQESSTTCAGVTG